MKNEQVVHNYFSELGKKSYAARVKKHGKGLMTRVSKAGVEARRKLVISDDPKNNCRVCGADHTKITRHNRTTYRKAHEDYLLMKGATA